MQCFIEIKLFRKSRIGENKQNRQLPVLIEVLVLIRVLILVHRTRRLTKTLAVALAGVRRFELRLLSGRHEMRVSFQIFDNFFGNHFAFETPQRALDRFVIIY